MGLILYLLELLIAIPYIIIRIIYEFCSGYFSEKEKIKKRKAKKAEHISNIETGIKNSSGVLFYVVRGYNNKGSLKQFVDFVLPYNQKYKVITESIQVYLKSKGKKHLLEYWKRSPKYKGTIVVSDMGQMYLEKMFSEVLNRPIIMKRLDELEVDN